MPDKLPDTTSEHVKGPLHHEDGIIWQTEHVGDGAMVAQIRGWGYLTGRGALGLSGEEAAAIQDEWGELFAAAPETAAERDRLRALCGEMVGVLTELLLHFECWTDVEYEAAERAERFLQKAKEAGVE